MRVALISTYTDIQSIGVRILAACLKRAGHQVRTVYLIRRKAPQAVHESELRKEYDDRVIRDLSALCGDTHLVAFSSMTEDVFRIRFLIRSLKALLPQPFLWGGVHPTVQPEECLQYADYVCLGEGEKAFPELLDALSAGSAPAAVAVRGIAYRQDGQIVSHGVAPMVEDLDRLPFPDYDLADSYVLDTNALEPLTPALLQRYVMKEAYDMPTGGTYGIITSRGCPYACTFCTNNVLRKLYGRGYRVRRRSMENVIEELAQAKARLPFIQGVRFHDDVFLSADVADLRRFGELYRHRIGLPFACYSSPKEISAEKLDMLCRAGLVRVGMGIQTGSQKTQTLYGRAISNDTVLRAAQILTGCKSQLIPPWYDIITDNPYEREEDRMATLELLGRLPLPFTLHVYAMTFFPGTALCRKAVADGTLSGGADSAYTSSYNVVTLNYLNLLLYSFKYNRYVPIGLTRWLSSRRLVRVLNRPWLQPIFRIPFTGLKGIIRAQRAWRRRAAG